ncbi:MAG: hypothetical protein PHS59_00355 [Paludibacter sp.]|nr:hypothetical protein [Paludibacter sp.]
MNVGWIAKSVTEKNNRRVDCAEATKKTVQAMRNEWWGFFVAGDCPAELPVIIYQVKPDRFQPNFFLLDFIPISQINQIFTFEFQKTYLGCGVAVAEGIKAFTINDYIDFSPQLN